MGDVITVDAEAGGSKLIFMREEEGALVSAAAAAHHKQAALVPVSTESAATRALAVRISGD